MADALSISFKTVGVTKVANDFRTLEKASSDLDRANKKLQKSSKKVYSQFNRLGNMTGMGASVLAGVASRSDNNSLRRYGTPELTGAGKNMESISGVASHTLGMKIGTMMGTFIAGPIGTVVGLAIGGVLGSVTENIVSRLIVPWADKYGKMVNKTFARLDKKFSEIESNQQRAILTEVERRLGIKKGPTAEPISDDLRSLGIARELRSSSMKSLELARKEMSKGKYWWAVWDNIPDVPYWMKTGKVTGIGNRKFQYDRQEQEINDSYKVRRGMIANRINLEMVEQMRGMDSYSLDLMKTPQYKEALKNNPQAVQALRSQVAPTIQLTREQRDENFKKMNERKQKELDDLKRVVLYVNRDKGY